MGWILVAITVVMISFRNHRQDKNPKEQRQQNSKSKTHKEETEN